MTGAWHSLGLRLLFRSRLPAVTSCTPASVQAICQALCPLLWPPYLCPASPDRYPARRAAGRLPSGSCRGLGTGLAAGSARNLGTRRAGRGPALLHTTSCDRLLSHVGVALLPRTP